MNKHHILIITALALFAPALTPSGRSESVRGLNREGLEAYREKEFSKALSRFEKAGENDPDNLLLDYNIGAALAARNKDVDALGFEGGGSTSAGQGNGIVLSNSGHILFTARFVDGTTALMLSRPELVPIFESGFETGSTSDWSSTVP